MTEIDWRERCRELNEELSKMRNVATIGLGVCHLAMWGLGLAALWFGAGLYDGLMGDPEADIGASVFGIFFSGLMAYGFHSLIKEAS